MTIKVSWWDVLLAVCIIGIALPQMLIAKSYVQVPGPMYGGDLYIHYGHTLHIRDGGSVFMSSYYASEYEAYPWLSHAFVALVSVVLGVSLLSASFIVVPFLVIAGSAVLMYLLGARIFGQRPFGVALAVLWMSWLIPTPSPTTVAVMLMVPALILAFSSIHSWKHGIIAGLVLGVAALQHFTAFLGGAMLLAFLGLLHLFRQVVQVKKGAVRIKRDWRGPVIGILKSYGLAILIGGIISLLYFAPVFFAYHFQTPNPWQTYTAGGVGNVSIFAGLRLVWTVLVDFSGVAQIILSLVALSGFYAAWRLRMLSLPVILLLVGLVGFLHPLITIPLLGTSFGHYRFNIFLYPAKYLLVTAAAFLLWQKVTQVVKKPVRKWVSVAVLACILIFSILQFNSAFTQHKNDQWTKTGQTLPDATRALLDLGDRIRAEVPVDAVFLASHGESAFALNVISGRKIVFMRRTHASPYVDVNERIADSAVILYGNDDVKREELLDRYDVAYYYDDFYAAQSRQQCVAAWDSLAENPEASYACLTVTPEWAGYLAQYNVTFQRVTARFDPSLTDAPRFEQLAILPLEQPRFSMQPVFVAQMAQGAAAVVYQVVRDAR